MSFEILTKTKARVTSVSINGENHGKDIQPAVTLALKMTVHNDWLNCLSPRLKSSFYMPDGSVKTQPDLPGTEISEMPFLRLPEAGSLPWLKEYTGLDLIIDHGIGGDSDIEVTDSKADDIVLTFLEGGSTEVAFKIKSNKPDEATRGQLTSTIKRDIEILVYGPKLDPQQSFDDGPSDPPAAAPSPAPDTGGEDDEGRGATDAFIARNTGADANE